MERHEPGSQKKRKRGTVLWCVLALLIGGAVMLGIWQKNNLKALYLTFFSDEESLSQRQEQQTQKRDDILLQYGLKPPAPKPEDPEKDDPEVTQPAEGLDDEPADTQVPVIQPDVDGETTTDPVPDQETEVADEAKVQAEIQAEVEKLYQLEDQFHARLDELVQESKDEYRALPKEERTQANKVKIVKSKTETLIAEEKSCDAQVENILSAIQNILDREGMSGELVKEIRTYYEESKATWKAAKMTELYS